MQWVITLLFKILGSYHLRILGFWDSGILGFWDSGILGFFKQHTACLPSDKCCLSPATGNYSTYP